MKSIFALFLVFYLLQVANISYARKDLGGYWKKMMMNQPMPDAIEDLIEEPRESDDDAGKDRFVRDFDVKPNVILYHTHVVSKKQEKPFAKNELESEFKKHM